MALERRHTTHSRGQVHSLWAFLHYLLAKLSFPSARPHKKSRSERAKLLAYPARHPVQNFPPLLRNLLLPYSLSLAKVLYSGEISYVVSRISCSSNVTMIEMRVANWIILSASFAMIQIDTLSKFANFSINHVISYVERQSTCNMVILHTVLLML